LNFDEREYLDSVKLSDGQTIESNYWFDCSGFNRVLMGKTKNKWISYKDNLPTNTAIPFSTDISSKSVKFETLAKALNSGWMWKIPLHHRHGCGYVYCDAFQNEDESVRELEKTLGYKVDPIKTIKFEPGRYEKIWYNNIIAVGLSSHFLEPLQATSIHIAIHSVVKLIFDHMKGYITYEHVDNRLYNNAIGVVIDDYKDFLQMHYLAGREDTPFWKFITNELKITDRNQEFINISKFRTLGLSDIQNTVGSAGFPLWCHILDNSGLYSKENIKWELEHFGQMERAYKEIDDLKRNYDSIKSKLVSNEEFFKYLKI
jgi:tryptophan halogenase